MYTYRATATAVVAPPKKRPRSEVALSCDRESGRRPQIKRPRSEVALLLHNTSETAVTTFSKSCTAAMKSADATSISI